MEVIRVKLGFTGKLVVDSVGRSGVLYFMWKNLIDVSLLSYSRFHIDVKMVSQRDVSWRWTCFYGNPKASQRPHGWTLLRRFCSISYLPWVCVRDFNEILCSEEKLGGSLRPQAQIEEFPAAIDDCGLQDMGFRSPRSPRCNKRECANMV
ncbi:hypothetical protein Ddye_017110 [Dipteronia dyeriana]|uniref:Uncharacterized protein n=1 Tax=Dipteronia dyeriana TaxID=168575 RepID=A0AAD9X071_9ROSI|nr:hypothetical protein Ddye_017110 [Dipteronia dyeriana]